MEIVELKKITQNFVNELTLSQNGHKTSLAFIKNPLPTSPLIKPNETFQVMVIGGTIFQSAVLSFKNNQLTILKLEETKLPLLTNMEVFFSFIESFISSEVNTLVLNLAFPLDPIYENGKLDGIFLQSMKEHPLTDLIGKRVGAGLQNYLFRQSNIDYAISVANDTTCLILSGLTIVDYDNICGGIIGSGLNFGFFLDKNTLVNLEAADFDKFPRTPEGKEINRMSVNPKVGIFEKEIAGAYLYQHFNLLAPQNNIKSLVLHSTKELTEIALSQENPTASKLAREILGRSAELASCAIAGIANFKKQDMTFVMQGSLFWKGYKYKETVEQTVKKLCPEFKIDFIQIDHADILGAAKLVA